MLPNSMKILTLNTNNASPISVQSESRIQPINKVINSSSQDEPGGGRAGCAPSSKTNKRDQKHSNKNKFVHGHMNKMQQNIPMQHQHQQLQKYHNKNSGSKLNNQHYGNINSNNHNTSSLVNRKKYYQQPQHHQQHQQQYQHQQQKYITNMQKSTNSSQTTTTFTNNINRNLDKNQNYNNTDLLSLQQQSNQQKYQPQQRNVVTNLEHFSKDLKESRTCFLKQDNCDKLSQPSFPPDCSSSATKTSDCQSNNICCDNRAKICSTSNEVQATATTATACISCWKSFKKSSQQLQPETSINFELIKVNALATNCDTNENLPKTAPTTSQPLSREASSSSIFTYNQSELSSDTFTSSSVLNRRKSFFKSSNTGEGVAISVETDVNRRLSSGYSSDSTNQSPKLSKEKPHHVWDKNFSTSSNLMKNTNESCNDENFGRVAANTNPNQQTHISKHQVQAADKIAMTTSLATSIEPLTLIKTSLATSSQSPKTQQSTLEKTNDTKQILKTLSKTGNGNTNKTVTTTSSSSSTSTSSLTSQNSYTLDFLHSVGVKMTGGALRTPEMQETKNNYRNQTLTNSPAHNTCPYDGMSTNQRQPRYMCGGANTNGGNNGSQMQNYHHQPSQLTIASFMNKELLGRDNKTPNLSCSSNNRGNSSSSHSRNTNTYQDRQQPSQYSQRQQHHQQNNPRYHQDYNAASYPQQSAVMQHTNYGGGGGVHSAGHRSSGYNYTNYHNNPREHGIAKNNTMTQLHSRQLKNNVATFKNSVNSSQVNKKSTYASSTTSSGSLSSSKSFSSNTSNISNRQLQTIVNQDSSTSTSSSNLNLAIETLPSKVQNGGNQRIGHRGHHNCHHGHHHGNQHLMMNSPNVLHHQNYHNLTYVTTDASAFGAVTSKGGSAAPQSMPTTSPTNCNSPKPPLHQSPGHATMIINFNANQLQYPRFQHAQILAAQQQQQQFHQFQQHQKANILNKKVFVPLSVNLASPSRSPTLTTNSQQPTPQNIVCCSQLDEASTAAAASSSGIIAGNGYESDNSSNHSSTQIKYHSIKSLKSSISSSSSSTSSGSGISLKPQQVPQRFCVQSATLATTSTPTVPVHSPMDMNYCGTTPQVFSNQQLPQFYESNGGGSTVISLLNVPAKSENNFSDEEYLHKQQQQQFSLSSTPNQRSPDQINIPAANHSNNSNNGYWSPSYQNNQFIYHQFASTQTALIPPISSSSSSCGSSSASISPRLSTDDLHTQTQPRLQNNCGIVVAGLSPSSCSSLNQQLSHIVIGNSSNSDSGMFLAGSSSSSNSSVSGYSNNGSDISINTINVENNSKRNSSQFLAPQKNCSTAHKTCQSSSSSVSSLSNSSASTLTSAVRSRSGMAGGNGYYNNSRCHSQLLPSPQGSVASLVESSNSGSQNLPSTATQHFYSHYQSLPPPLPPHNLLYNNPQTHHIRALSTSSVHDFFTHTPPDRFLARAHLIEAKEAPAALLNNSKWDHISQDIWKRFINAQQTEETFKSKMRLWRYLYVFVKNAYPRYGLYVVGSTISGFGSDSSDVDMCLVSRSASTIDPRLEALFNLTVLRDCLSKSGQFENFNLIEAKVPILRFCDSTHQLEVDLNFNNCVGIKNTHLLCCYSQLDWRLRPLVVVTKLWAQYHNINNAKNMTISSYSLVLMVIHFLQSAVNPPVLPCLHEIFPDKFPLLRSNDFGYVDLNETISPYESKNTQTIGELFLMFLEYYSFFDYTQYAISVRTGGLLPINECRVAKSIKNDVHQWKELCIEEPFDLTNTARSVYDFETFERVKAVFVASWRILQETLDLNSVFSTILLPSPCSHENVIMHRKINSLLSSATPFNHIVASSVDANGTKINYQQCAKEYEGSSLEHNYKDSVVDVAGDYIDDGDNDAAAIKSFTSTACKIRTRKVKVYSEKDSIKTSAKNINASNNTNSNRTVSAMVS